MPATLGILIASTIIAATPSAKPVDRFNRPGNVLIADQLNNRVIEVDSTGDIVWQFGAGPDDVSGKSPIGPRSVRRSGDLTLIAIAGAAPGAEPACPKGCPDSRVLLVDRKGKVVWQYADVDRPLHAVLLPSGHVLIADTGNHRVIEVDRATRKVVWQHGKTGSAGSGPGELSRPGSVEALDSGNLLIADTGNDRAIEVTRDHAVAATYTAGGTTKEVTAAAPARDTGNVLISEQGHRRVAELDAADKAIWSKWTYVTTGSNPDPQVSCVRRLRNGDTLLCDQKNHRVLRVDGHFNEVGSYGNLNQPGFGTKSASEGLNAPYDADVIGE